MAKTITFWRTDRCGYLGHYCLIVPDHAAGRRNRYTTYLIPSSPAQSVRVIGRELTLGQSKRIALRHPLRRTPR